MTIYSVADRGDDAVELSGFFSAPEAGARLRLAPFDGATPLWRHPASGLDDRRLLENFAFVVQEDGNAVGWADRYGGSGLGTNAGSGRAAYVNGAYVKGVGKTPLIGNFDDPWHTTGLCFVDEAMRECVFSAIVAAESPWGAANIMGVIDLGIAPDLGFETAEDYSGRRVLLIRENVLRPAHFERAPGVVTSDRFAGEIDEERVNRNVTWAARHLAPGFEEQYREFWMRWGEQLVYQFVHRITQTTPTTSNIALDGRLLDFGAARATPDWSSYVPGPQRPPFGTEIAQLGAFLEQAGHDVFTRLMPGCDPATTIKEVLDKVVERVNHSTMVEVFRLLGFRRETVERWLSTHGAKDKAAAAIGCYVRDAQRCFRYEADWPAEEDRWDLPLLWSNPTRRLARLRVVAEEILSTVRDEPVQARCAFLTRSRPELNHARLNESIKAELLPDLTDPTRAARTFSRFLNKTVARNRRRSRVEPVRHRPVGFFSGDTGSLALFRSANGALWASDEAIGMPTFEQVLDIADSSLALDGDRVVHGEMFVINE